MNSDQALDFENLLTMGVGGVPGAGLDLGAGLLMEQDEILARNRQNSSPVSGGGNGGGIGVGFGSAGVNQGIIQQQPLAANNSGVSAAVTAVTTTTSSSSSSSASNRYSYRAAIYRSEAQQDLG